MHIAVLLGGQVRTWRRCVASQLALFPNHEVDFYLQAWEPAPQVELSSAYGARECLVEPQKLFHNKIIDRMLPTKDFPVGPGTPGRAKAMLSQYCAVRSAWRLTQDRQHDVFVRMRYDALFREPLPRLLEGLGENDCRVPFWRDDENGTNDHFAVMGPSAAKHYFGMFEFLIDRAKKPRHKNTMFHFTRTLERCLKQGNVNIKERAIPYLIVRSDFAHFEKYAEMAKRIGQKNEGATFKSIIRRNHE